MLCIAIVCVFAVGLTWWDEKITSGMFHTHT